MKYRIKTDAELKAAGYVKTPKGEYIHLSYPNLNEDKAGYSKLLSEELLQMIINSEESIIVDGYIYSSSHFTQTT